MTKKMDMELTLGKQAIYIKDNLTMI